MHRKASILTALALGSSLTAAPVALLPGGSGVSAAAAAHVYTRKRVNGRWITGRFGKADARAGRGRRRAAARGRPAAPEPDETPAPLPPTRPADAARPPSLANRVISTASITPAPDEPRLEHMRPALEAKARALAGDVLALPVPDLPPAVGGF